MINFTKGNLIEVPKEGVQSGTPAIMVNDMVLLLQRGVDVSDTTATAPDVLEGKKFYNADGQPTVGTLVQGGGTSGGGEFYLCSYVNRNYFSYNTIIVSGMPTTPFAGATYNDYDSGESGTLSDEIGNRNPNGTYTLTNPDEQYPSNYIWKSENGCRIRTHPWGSGFVIYPGDYDDLSKYLQYSDDMGSSTYPVPDDYTSFTWSYYDGSTTTTVEGGSVAVPEPAPVEQYWEGYKLIPNEDGKYDYATETTRLTYADYMPVTGRIYDGGCTMEITNVNLSDDALWSCPRNMTGYENDEWVISASSYYDGSYPWQAFDNDMHKIWYARATAEGLWLQWQNKKRKVLIRELCIYCDDYMEWNTYCFLQGSDDGVTWTDLRRGVFAGLVAGDNVYEDGFCKVVVKLPNNGTAFYYHRFGQTSTGVAGMVRHVVARPQFERTVPKTAPKVSDKNEV